MCGNNTQAEKTTITEINSNNDIEIIWVRLHTCQRQQWQQCRHGTFNTGANKATGSQQSIQVKRRPPVTPYSEYFTYDFYTRFTSVDYILATIIQQSSRNNIHIQSHEWEWFTWAGACHVQVRLTNQRAESAAALRRKLQCTRNAVV